MLSVRGLSSNPSCLHHLRQRVRNPSIHGTVVSRTRGQYGSVRSFSSSPKYPLGLPKGQEAELIKARFTTEQVQQIKIAFPDFSLRDVDQGSKSAFTALASAINRRDIQAIRQMATPDLAEQIIETIQQSRPQEDPGAAKQPQTGNRQAALETSWWEETESWISDMVLRRSLQDWRVPGLSAATLIKRGLSFQPFPVEQGSLDALRQLIFTPYDLANPIAPGFSGDLDGHFGTQPGQITERLFILRAGCSHFMDPGVQSLLRPLEVQKHALLRTLGELAVHILYPTAEFPAISAYNSGLSEYTNLVNFLQKTSEDYVQAVGQKRKNLFDGEALQSQDHEEHFREWLSTNPRYQKLVIRMLNSFMEFEHTSTPFQRLLRAVLYLGSTHPYQAAQELGFSNAVQEEMEKLRERLSFPETLRAAQVYPLLGTFVGLDLHCRKAGWTGLHPLIVTGFGEVPDPEKLGDISPQAVTNHNDFLETLRGLEMFFTDHPGASRFRTAMQKAYPFESKDHLGLYRPLPDRMSPQKASFPKRFGNPFEHLVVLDAQRGPAEDDSNTAPVAPKLDPTETLESLLPEDATEKLPRQGFRDDPFEMENLYFPRFSWANLKDTPIRRLQEASDDLAMHLRQSLDVPEQTSASSRQQTLDPSEKEGTKKKPQQGLLRDILEQAEKQTKYRRSVQHAKVDQSIYDGNDYLRDLLADFDPLQSSEHENYLQKLVSSEIPMESESVQPSLVHKRPNFLQRLVLGPAARPKAPDGIPLSAMVDLRSKMHDPEIRDRAMKSGDPKSLQELRRWSRLTYEQNVGKSRDWSHPYWSNAIRLRQKVFGEDLALGGTWSELTASELLCLEKLSKTPFMDFKVLGERQLSSVQRLFENTTEYLRFRDRFRLLSTVAGLPAFQNDPSWDAWLLHLIRLPQTVRHWQGLLRRVLRASGILADSGPYSGLQMKRLGNENYRFFHLHVIEYPSIHLAPVLPTAPLQIPRGLPVVPGTDKGGSFLDGLKRKAEGIKTHRRMMRPINLHREWSTGILDLMLMARGELEGFDRNDPNSPRTLLHPLVVESLRRSLRMHSLEAMDEWLDRVPLHPEAVRLFLPLEWKAAHNFDGKASEMGIGRIHPSAFKKVGDSALEKEDIADPYFPITIGAPRPPTSEITDIFGTSPNQTGAGGASASSSSPSAKHLRLDARLKYSNVHSFRLKTPRGILDSKSGKEIPEELLQAEDVTVDVDVHLASREERIFEDDFGNVVEGSTGPEEFSHLWTFSTPLREGGRDVDLDWILSRTNDNP